MGNCFKKPSKVRIHDQQEELSETELEINEEDFTCEICRESITGKRFKNMNKCCHPFCTDCMIKYITAKLEDNNVGHIKCRPALNCDHMLDPFSCSSLISPKLFLEWSDVLCEEALYDSDKCYCPYKNCNRLILNECGGNPTKSMCPSCKRWLCFQCKSFWHAGFKCDESKEAVTNLDDVVFWKLAEEMKWRRCPKCRHFVESSGGCRRMKCRPGVG